MDTTIPPASEISDSTVRLAALANKFRQRARTSAPLPTDAVQHRERYDAFDAAAAAMRKTKEIKRNRYMSASEGDTGRHSDLAQRFETLLHELQTPAKLNEHVAAPSIAVNESARASHTATLRALSSEREWWRVLSPSGEVADVRQLHSEWPWESDADTHAIRPGEPGWQSVVRRRYALLNGLPSGTEPAPAVGLQKDGDSSSAWLALCGMPPAVYISAVTAGSTLPERTADVAVMMRRLGVIDPWSPAAAQLDAAAVALAAREADSNQSAADMTRESPALDLTAVDADGLPAVKWELAAVPQLDYYRRGAPVATAALAAPADSIAQRVRVAFNAAHEAFHTRELLNTAADSEARLVMEVAARRIQHAWRGSRKIAAARAELWGRRERVRSAALHRLATVQDAMVQFCRVLEQGVGLDMGATEILQQQERAPPSALQPFSGPRTGAARQQGSVNPTTKIAPNPAPATGSLTATIGSALGAVTNRVTAAAQVVSTPGRAATPIALRISRGGSERALPGTLAPSTESASAAHSHLSSRQALGAEATLGMQRPSELLGPSSIQHRVEVGASSSGNRTPIQGSPVVSPSRSGLTASATMPPAQTHAPLQIRGSGDNATPRTLSSLPPPHSSYSQFRPRPAAANDLSEPLKLLQELATHKKPSLLSPFPTAKPALQSDLSPRESSRQAGLMSPAASSGLPTSSIAGPLARQSASVHPLGSTYQSMASSAATFAGMTPVVLSETDAPPMMDAAEARRVARRYDS